ncbi:MAG: hypothetical protein CL607_21390 [Anaerolineaceae bacterium]|nr:hypothetical protein [Anaerolineaceae bacterium]MCA9886740.1 metal-sensitive transcriptional regulator [Anaerolineae bacterium]MCA9891365.1 metal-sensitive transcriptional regulator [Anaerolineae bacterium]
MTDKSPEKWKRSIQRLNRIQGQITALKAAIDQDQDCESLIIQTRAIEKAVSSLIAHIVENHVDYCMSSVCENETDTAISSFKRLIKLSLK